MNLLDLSVCRKNLSLKVEDSQWLLIQKAKEEEVLKIEFKLHDEAVKELVKVCNDAYLKGSEGTSAHLWNEQRKLILHDKISNILLPSMEKEARALLNGKAKKFSLLKYGMQFWNTVCVAPYQNNENTAAHSSGLLLGKW
jgi:transcription elongation factor SPT6